MFFVFGFGKQTVKNYGETPEQYCNRCHNQSPRNLTKATSWFTLFFIPVIPYRTRYMLICPICGNVQELSQEEFEEISGSLGIGKVAARGYQGSGSAKGPQPRTLSDESKYAGKTPTQIAYLKKIEKYEKSLAAQEEAQGEPKN